MPALTRYEKLQGSRRGKWPYLFKRMWNEQAMVQAETATSGLPPLLRSAPVRLS